MRRAYRLVEWLIFLHRMVSSPRGDFHRLNPSCEAQRAFGLKTLHDFGAIPSWRELRARGEAGRAALVQLMGSGNPHVRAWAASHVLEFDPRAAEAELERLASGPPSIVRLDAEMTLKEWKAGHLKFTES
jgi:hypothetical protein